MTMSMAEHLKNPM